MNTAENLLRNVLRLIETRGDLQRFYDKITGTAPASAEPVKDEAREIIAEFVRLADMGLEESLKEPEENGNFAAYERAKRFLGLTIDT